MDVLAKMEYNPYLSDQQKKLLEEARRQAPPVDVLERLKNYRWQTKESASAIYISRVLGKLQRDGFEFAYPSGWKLWPTEYLDEVLSYAASVDVLMQVWKQEADKESRVLPYKDSRKVNAGLVKATTDVMKRFRSMSGSGRRVPKA